MPNAIKRLQAVALGSYFSIMLNIGALMIAVAILDLRRRLREKTLERLSPRIQTILLRSLYVMCE